MSVPRNKYKISERPFERFKALIKLGVLVAVLLANVAIGQELYVGDLHKMCKMENWDGANRYLLNKGWEYYESEKGTSYEYDIITYTFGRDEYNNKATGWLHLYAFQNIPSKISYSIFSKDHYAKILNTLPKLGYKLDRNEVMDDRIRASYENDSFILQILTAKFEDEDYTFRDRTVTGYTFIVTEKSSIYDPDNGLKQEYYDSGNLQVEYHMKDGEIHGSFTVYYPDGQVKRKGSYSHGFEDGEIVEYDENGEITTIYSMLEGRKDGVYKAYENGRISVTKKYVDGYLNGPYSEVVYDDDSGDVIATYEGNYSNDNEHGLWQIIVMKDDTERVISFWNYENGLLNGEFMKPEGDTLIVGSYRDDKLHGRYREYLDFNHLMIGGIINTDTTELDILARGSYHFGDKSGKWQYYSLSGDLIREGRYEKGLKTGEWNYFHTHVMDMNQEKYAFSGKLYLTETYLNGELHGPRVRLSEVFEESYPCKDDVKDRHSIDTCYSLQYIQYEEIANYSHNELDGSYSLEDSLGNLLETGNYLQGLKHGLWKEVTYNDEFGYFSLEGTYYNGKKNGKWEESSIAGRLLKSSMYSDDQLHGSTIYYNDLGKPKKAFVYRFNTLKEISYYNTEGTEKTFQFVLQKETYSIGDTWRRIDFHSTGVEMQDFVLKKYLIENSGGLEQALLKYVNLNLESSHCPREGLYELSDSNGKKLVTGQYSSGKKIGEWKFFFYSQGVKMFVQMKSGEFSTERYFDLDGNPFSGEFVLVNEEDQIKEVRNIKDGLRHGKTKFIDTRTDEVTSFQKYKDGELKE